MTKLLLLVAVLFSLEGDPLQDQTLENISQAMSAGSSKELIKFCGDNIEIKIEGKSSSYSLSQAEVVLKDFFLKHPAKSFSYIHQGASPEGLKYTIGSFKAADASYRVVMVIKKQGAVYKIDQINFSRE